MTKIISNSRELWKNTPEYREKVKKIKKKLHEEYQPLIKHESNFIKKGLLMLKRRLNIKQAINALTSYHKMYLALN